MPREALSRAAEVEALLKPLHEIRPLHNKAQDIGVDTTQNAAYL